MNGLVAYGRPVAIVLDDLHAVASRRSLGSMEQRALGRLPANVRLLASTRSDPAINLARLRARGALAEIRVRELAFDIDEARVLIEREGIELSGESLELLVERTEGWPAGLYLAALWLRDLEDADKGVRAFAGSARHLGDYLTAEVLTALPPDTRDFLVKTSVLGRFTPELCDAVLGRDDSAAVLAELARSNMFLVALEPHGKWYRYHHLFGELLALELDPQAAPALRRRAAAWCRAHGLVEDAIEYAAAAGSAETVAELLLETHLEFIWGGRVAQFLGWVRRLPPELLDQHPLLAAVGATAAALLAHPEVEVQRLLAVAERSRAEHPHTWSPYIEAVVEVTRAETIERGDVGAAVEHARRALAASRAGAAVLTVGILATLSQALYFAGELDESRSVALQAAEHPDAPARPDGYVGSLGYSRCWMANKVEARARLRGRIRRSATHGSDSRRTLGSRRRRTWGWRSPPRRPDVSTRLSARRCTASDCAARPSQRLVTLTPCSYARRSAPRAPGWRWPRPTSNAPGG